MPKRKAPANPSPPAILPAVPSVLPPSVEEAYRRKCMELKQRSKEVDDVNDATKLRISRLRRQVDKLRVERAFLLEQLSRRTSTNVEDSDGSPSPPPTPEDKPLRIKRGHRKPSILTSFEANPVAGSTFINQNLATLSPSSDAFAHHAEHKDGRHQDPSASRSNPASGMNGVSSLKPPKKPSTAFEIYAAARRDELKDKQKYQQKSLEDDAILIDMEEEITTSWNNLPEDEKEAFHARERSETEQYKKDKEEYELRSSKAGKASKNGNLFGVEKDLDSKIAISEKTVKQESSSSKEGDEESSPKAALKRESQDEDVEMMNYYTDQEQADAEA